MKPRTRRDGRLKRRFDNAKKLKGIVHGRQIRRERQMWKRTMSKHGRKLDQDAIDESFDLIDAEEDDCS